MIKMELHFNLTVISDFNNGCIMHDDGIAITKHIGKGLKFI